jgi:hypothetical protein
MAEQDASRGVHPSDPAEGAASDEDANSPAQQRKGIQADKETADQPTDAGQHGSSEGGR